MGKIFMLLGKSASGKDSALRAIKDEMKDEVIPIVMYTTRPKRDGEIEGVEYHFINEPTRYAMLMRNEVIEERCYKTVFGDWYYLTSKEDIDLEHHSYVIIGTLEVLRSFRKIYGSDVISIYIYADDKTRLLRSIERSTGGKSDLKEICRRYLQDEDDFEDNKIASSKINLILPNNKTIKDCTDCIITYMRGKINSV